MNPDHPGVEALLERNGLALLIRAHPDNIYVFTLDGTFVDCNENVVTLTGYTKDELRAMSFDPVITEDHAEMTRQYFGRACIGETVNYLTRARSKNGVEFVLDVTNLPLRDDSGTIVAVMGIARDVGETSRLRELVHRDQVARRIAGKLAKFGGWSLEVPSGELFWSEELYGLLGVEPGNAPPVEFALTMYPEPHRGFLERALEACITTGEPIDLDSVIRDAQGREFPVHIVAEAVRDDAGDIIRVAGAFQDITDVVAGRDERIRLEAQLRQTLDQITHGIFFIDREWFFTFVNKVGERYVGTTAEGLLGRTMWELFPDAWGNSIGLACRRAMDDRVIRIARDYYPPLSTWFEATVYPTAEGVALYLRDVTEDERIAQEMKTQTARLREQANLLDVARDAMMVIGLDHTITYWNHGAEELYGWSAREAVGSSIASLLSMDSAEVAAATGDARRDGHWLGEAGHYSRDGRRIIAECRWQCVYDDAGEPTTIFAVHTDVTAARREQKERIRAQRLESIGTLAGGIAHDLNNVLTPILMTVQLLDEVESDDEKRAMLKNVEASARRGADMIRQVLLFAQGSEGERRLVLIEDLLEELRAFCRTTLPSSIDVRIDTEQGGGLWAIEGDGTQLLQVFVNLVTNARDAVGESGRITVRAANRVVEHNQYTPDQIADPGDYVVIEVEDDGHGMSDEIAARIFEPFFTTKDIGSGTGLGLPTSFSIVQSLGGRMQVYSEPGVGTKFEILLPRYVTATASPASSTAESPRSSALPTGSGERILVIDDEASIRTVVSRTLSSNGYVTLTAANGREGIELLESLDSRVDLVLTDMQMPVMDGAATVGYLSQHHPDVIVVAASGLNANSGVARARHAGAVHFIPKPFTTESLLTTIASALRPDQAEGAPDRG